MQAKPVKKYPHPKYPTKLEILDNPKLLEKNIPSGWKKRVEIAGLVSLFLSANCQLEKSILDPTLKSDDPAIVAPIFIHGAGRGVIGCVVVTPPVFLSEEEALQVINEELRRHGFHITSNNTSLKNIFVHHNQYYVYNHVNNERILIQAEDKPLEVDVYNEHQKVAIEYISEGDYDRFKKIDETGYWSSIETLDFQETAEMLRDQVKERGTGVYFGTFYDPIANMEEDVSWEEYHDKMDALANESKQYLKEQVYDFMNWLKAQGVM